MLTAVTAAHTKFSETLKVAKSISNSVKEEWSTDSQSVFRNSSMMYEADLSSGILLFHRALGHCHPCRDFSHSCILFQSFSWISSLCSLSLLFLRDLIYQLVQASALSGPFFYQFSFSETVSITKIHSQSLNDLYSCTAGVLPQQSCHLFSGKTCSKAPSAGWRLLLCSPQACEIARN